jgi:hypothetical protein
MQYIDIKRLFQAFQRAHHKRCCGIAKAKTEGLRRAADARGAQAQLWIQKKRDHLNGLGAENDERGAKMKDMGRGMSPRRHLRQPTAPGRVGWSAALDSH